MTSELVTYELDGDVALLGLKITLDQVQSLGWQSVFMVVLAVSLTITLGIVVAKWMGFKPFFGLLSGGSVGICGASAAMAIAAAFPNHPQKDRATLFVVISVSTLSTVAMVLYPMLAHGLALDAQQSGFFLGSTIHDVAQVVGAGYSMGQETGDAATVVKLMRVAMLVPVIMVAAWMTRAAHAQSMDSATAGAPASRPPLLPWFAVVFVVLVLLNSLLHLPEAVVSAGLAVCPLATELIPATATPRAASSGWVSTAVNASGSITEFSRLTELLELTLVRPKAA